MAGPVVLCRNHDFCTGRKLLLTLSEVPRCCVKAEMSSKWLHSLKKVFVAEHQSEFVHHEIRFKALG